MAHVEDRNRINELGLTFGRTRRSPLGRRTFLNATNHYARPVYEKRSLGYAARRKELERTDMLFPDVITSINNIEGHVTVTFEGDLDLYTVPNARPYVLNAAEQAAESLVLDLSKVGYVDSAGLALIVLVHKLPSMAGKLTVHVEPGTHPDRILRLTRFDMVMTVEPAPTTDAKD
jgi:anti-sigma B factor antagonist